jgi:prolyl 4-hydroxylase
MSFENLGPAIFIHKNFLTNPDEYIQMAENHFSWVSGEISKNKTTYRASNISQMFNHSDDHILKRSLSKKISELGEAYAFENDIPKLKAQRLQLVKYDPGQGFYGWHHDVSYTVTDREEVKKRVFSLVIYLNDVVKGGETEFKNFDLKVAPQAGAALVFPANFAYSHRANQPISNAKYVIVTWFEY